MTNFAIKWIKNGFAILCVAAALCFVLEIICLVAGVPQGSNRFVESVLIKSELSFRKPGGESRIFTYGESTMYGAHYGNFSSPALWLDEYLSQFLPTRSIRVVNFARLGCNSHFVLETVKQTLAYQPDLMIFYVGHNTFLPHNSKEEIERREKTFSYHLRSWFQRSRLFSAVYRQYLKFVPCKIKNFKRYRLKNRDIEIDPSPSSTRQMVIPRTDPRYAKI